MQEKLAVSIEYCVPGNYRERAVRAADDILADYQHMLESCELIMGEKGVFDVRVNGDLLYSKKAEGRHANEGEVLQRFREYVGPDAPTYSGSDPWQKYKEIVPEN